MWLLACVRKSTALNQRNNDGPFRKTSFSNLPQIRNKLAFKHCTMLDMQQLLITAKLEFDHNLYLDHSYIVIDGISMYLRLEAYCYKRKSMLEEALF